MIYGSVCSGIEAATLAWKPLGWKPAFFSEIEPFPRSVLQHYPDVPLHGDFTTIKGDEYGSIDLLVGGTPCQSFSIAGLRAGLDDPRGNLMLEFGALAKRIRPRWLVWENVPGVLSSNKGRDFGAFLAMLAELRYGFAYRVLDAQYFGVPQRRRRVFVVGHIGDWRSAAAVLFERHSLQGHPAPSRKTGEGFAHTTAPCLTSSGRWVERAGDTRGQDPVIAVASTGEVSHCLNAGGMGRQDYETETLIAHTLRGEGFDASEDGTGRGTPLVPVAIAGNCIGRKPENGGNGLGADDTGAMYTLTKTDRHAVAFQESEFGTQEYDVAGTQRAGRPGHTNNIRHGMQVRRLTPLECERLQGMPDGYTRIPTRFYKQRRITKLRPADLWEKIEDGWLLMSADGPRYKAIGNSMAVPVMRWIGERIQMVEDIQNTHID